MSDPTHERPPDGPTPECHTPDHHRGVMVYLATGLGVGWVPWASGTVGGAVWGLPLAYLLGQVRVPIQVVVILVVCAVGIPICTAACRTMGGAKDPGSIVLDEIASMPMTFFLVPMTGLQVVLAGFLLNRVFDIVKPPPARQLERLPEGLGVMADDWAAGIYSCLALHLLVWLDVLPS